MVDAALGGFLQGFMDDRTARMKEEQARRDELISNVQKMQMKGLQKRQEEWDRQDQMWQQVNSQAASDPTAAMATYADANNLKQKFEALGGKWEHSGSKEDTRAFLQSQYAKWQKMGRPELNAAELEKVQLRRAADDDAIAGPIRRLFGLGKDEHQGVAYENIKNGRFNLATEAGMEAAAADIIAQKEAELADTKAPKAVSAEEDTIVLSDIFSKQVGTGVSGKVKTNFQQIVNEKTGATDVWMINHINGQVVSKQPIIQKKGAKVEDNFTPVEKKQMAGVVDNALKLYSSQEGSDDAISDYGMSENGSAIISIRVHQILNSDAGRQLTAAQAADIAVGEFVQAGPYALSGVGGMFGLGEDDVWRNLVPMVSPEGEEKNVPWYQVGRAQNRNWSVKQ